MKYIKSNIQKIRHGQFKNHSLASLSGWSTIMGFQIENIVLNNRDEIKNKLGIYSDEVVYDNPYFQRKTARYKGCQIDYMIQTKHGNLYLCEVKFSRNVIRKDVIEEIKNKIATLSVPRNFSIKPILIHASEIHDEIVDSNFFVKTIDLSSFLQYK